MRALLLVFVLACGGGGANTRPRDPDPTPARSELQVRQEAVCEQTVPRLVDCRIETDKANATPKELAETDYDKTRVATIQAFKDKCVSGYMSSRQVRVWEVCWREEHDADCDTLVACLDNATPQN